MYCSIFDYVGLLQILLFTDTFIYDAIWMALPVKKTVFVLLKNDLICAVDYIFHIYNYS